MDSLQILSTTLYDIFKVIVSHPHRHQDITTTVPHIPGKGQVHMHYLGHNKIHIINDIHNKIY